MNAPSSSYSGREEKPELSILMTCVLALLGSEISSKVVGLEIR